MMVGTKLPSTTDRIRAYGARLNAEPLPSLILNCLTAEIVAANAGGLSALGLTRTIGLPYPLDGAMPAISAVRAIAHDELDTPTYHTLTFWRNGRAVTLPCRISRPDIELPAATALATHVLIVFQPAPVSAPALTHGAQTTASSTLADTIAANDDSPPRIIRDDHETLKEIARRILEAQKQTSPADGGFTPADLTKSQTQPPAATGAQEGPSEIARNGSVLAPSQIAKLAHELKTPLTAIAAAAEIMRDERLGAMGNEKYLGYAADIHSSAAHALAVIQDMLAIPASDASAALVPTSIAFDLTEVARGTVSSLQPLAQQRRLTLTLDAEPGLTPIRANATAIRQILLNLLTNALKFTPAGGEVRVVTGYLNDGAVFMVVRDTGDGIDAETLAGTFDTECDDSPANQAVRVGGGRGIGLKLVRRLAAENGAEFEIDSAPGKGTIVMLAFARDLAGTRP